MVVEGGILERIDRANSATFVERVKRSEVECEVGTLLFDEEE